MKRIVLCVAVMALLLGGVGQVPARAASVTFNFDSLTVDNAPDDSTAIAAYMNTVLMNAGYNLRVTNLLNTQVASGPFGNNTGPASQGNLTNNYIVNPDANGSYFEAFFNAKLSGLSVDYVVAPLQPTGNGGAPDFDVTSTGTPQTAYTMTQSSSDVGNNFTGSTGMVTLSFANNPSSYAISFHDDNIHQVAIDNLTIYFTDPPPAATPEPATLMLLGIGLAGIGGYQWRRRKVLVQPAIA